MFLRVTELMCVEIYFILRAHDFSILALVKWILSASLNIHTIKLSGDWDTTNSFHNEIAHLKKLKELDVSVYCPSNLTEVTLIAIRIMTTLLTSL